MLVKMKCRSCGTEWQAEQPKPEIVNAGSVSMLALPVRVETCPGLECKEQYRSVLMAVGQFQVGFVPVPTEQRQSQIVVPHSRVLDRIATARGPNGKH